jgi:hypothetical protein
MLLGLSVVAGSVVALLLAPSQLPQRHKNKLLRGTKVFEEALANSRVAYHQGRLFLAGPSA